VIFAIYRIPSGWMSRRIEPRRHVSSTALLSIFNEIARPLIRVSIFCVVEVKEYGVKELT
jgi:hypothetical protein